VLNQFAPEDILTAADLSGDAALQAGVAGAVLSAELGHHLGQKSEGRLRVAEIARWVSPLDTLG